MTHEEETKGGTSASNSASDRLCPGRHLAQKGLPDVPSAFSERGDRIHAALAQNERAGINHGARQGLTDEERDLFDDCRELERAAILEIWGGEPDQSNRVFREQRYWCRVPDKLTAPDGSPAIEWFRPHSGQADLVVFRKGIALVLDYKTGRSDQVESPRNEQLRDLAVMVWRTLNATEVVVTLIQPAFPIQTELCRYTAADLERAEQEMWDRVRKSNDPASPRVAGDLQCHFCKAKAQCKEHLAWAASLLPEKESPFKLFCQDWSLEQKSLVAENIPRLRKLLDDSEDFLKACLKVDPESVPGFYLKDGQTRESINNPQELFDRFAAAGGTLDQFMACVGITKAKLEAQVRIACAVKGKALKAKMDELLAGIVDVKQNQPSLARKKEDKP